MPSVGSPHGRKGRGKGKRRRGAFRPYAGSKTKKSGGKANMAEDEQELDQSYWGRAKANPRVRKEANCNPKEGSSLVRKTEGNQDFPRI